jgi:hypothetical protein
MKTVFVFDEARLSYDDGDLWNNFFGTALRVDFYIPTKHWEWNFCVIAANIPDGFLPKRGSMEPVFL